ADGGRRAGRQPARRLGGGRIGVRLAGSGPARLSVVVCPRPQSAAGHLLHLLLSGGADQHRRRCCLRTSRSSRSGRLMQSFWRRFFGNPRVVLSLLWLAFLPPLPPPPPPLS